MFIKTGGYTVEIAANCNRTTKQLPCKRCQLVLTAKYPVISAQWEVATEELQRDSWQFAEGVNFVCCHKKTVNDLGLQHTLQYLQGIHCNNRPHLVLFIYAICFAVTAKRLTVQCGPQNAVQSKRNCWMFSVLCNVRDNGERKRDGRGEREG